MTYTICNTPITPLVTCHSNDRILRATFRLGPRLLEIFLCLRHEHLDVENFSNLRETIVFLIETRCHTLTPRRIEIASLVHKSNCEVNLHLGDQLHDVAPISLRQHSLGLPTQDILATKCLKVETNLDQSCLQAFAKSCPKRCPRVVHVVPKWCEVV